MTLNIGQLVAYVRLDTSSVRRGAADTEAQMGRLGATMARTGTRSAGMMSKALGGVTMALGGLGLAKVAGDAVGLEASFSKSMAQISAATGATGADMDAMRALAMKMGADTAFSSNDAADAMLELAKAGITTKDIMGGGLQGTMLLAAAGGTDLGTATTIAANAMNTFNLRGKDMNKIAAALAGGANASSASVESLGQGLQQVGPGAKNAGLSLNETVGALSAFDAAGIKGSDAGTSLKTMLQNLTPATKKQSQAMFYAGLWSKKTGSAFVNTNGTFKSMTQIAGLLHDKLGKLSDAQKSQALTAIFGSDSSRAATVLMNEGSKGIRKYIKATEDQGAAQKMADANMSGTAGALEKMKGSIETAELAIGQALAPAVQEAAGAVGGFANGIAVATGWLQKHKPVAIALGSVIAALTVVTLAHNAAMAVGAAEGMANWLRQTKLITAATRVWAAVQWALDAAVNANPITLIVIGIAALIAAVVLIATKTTWFQTIWSATWSKVKDVAGAVFGWLTNAVGSVIGFVKKHWKLIVSILGGPLAAAVVLIVSHWKAIKTKTTQAISTVVGFVKDIPAKFVHALSSLNNKVVSVFRGAFNGGLNAVQNIGGTIVSWIAGIPGKMLNLGTKFGTAGKKLLQSFIDGMKNAAGIIAGIAGNVWKAVAGLLNGAIDKINAALEFKISIPGPDISVNLPDIPHLALRTGGRTRANSPGMAWIGDANEPESVLRDSQLRVLMREAVSAAMSKAPQPAAAGAGGPLIGQVVQQPGESAGTLAERLAFITRSRG